jgi:hypothetical protein
MMIRKYAVGALLLAVAPTVTGASASQYTGPAVTSTHTKRLMLHVTAAQSFDQRHFAGSERVRSRATGEVVGFDAFTGHVLSDRVVYETAFAFKGGVLLTRVHTVVGAPDRYVGRVIGGTGAYRRATGTVSGRAVSGEDTRFDIRYRL